MNSSARLRRLSNKLNLMRCLGLGLVAVGAMSVGVEASPQSSPSKKEVKQIFADYLEIDGRGEAGVEQRKALRERLKAHRPLKKSETKSWRKELLKLWAKGPELETSGTNYLWPDEKRGKYIVGGESKKPKGLAICMHGGGVGSGDAGSAKSSYDSAIRAMGWLAIYPEVLKKTERGWTDSGTEEFVMELIDRALRTWKIDHNRVYLVGHSMGGYGSWTLGAHHADRLAAVAPSAGAPSPRLGADGLAIDIEAGVVPNLRNLPMVIFQSADDPKVGPDANRVAVRKLNQAKKRWGGYEFEYWEVDGVGHGAPPGGFEAQLAKIAVFERGELPERVVWQPTITWKQQFYWLWWEKPRPGVILEADFDREGRRCTIRADKAAFGIDLLLDERLVDFKSEFSVNFNGKEVWRGVPERDLEVMVSTATHGDSGLIFEARIPVIR